MHSDGITKHKQKGKWGEETLTLLRKLKSLSASRSCFCRLLVNEVPIKYSYHMGVVCFRLIISQVRIRQ